MPTMSIPFLPAASSPPTARRLLPLFGLLGILIYCGGTIPIQAQETVVWVLQTDGGVEHATGPDELLALEAQGQLTLRALRAFGRVPDGFGRLALGLREQGIDLLDANAQALRGMLWAAEADRLAADPEPLRRLLAMLDERQFLDWRGLTEGGTIRLDPQTLLRGSGRAILQLPDGETFAVQPGGMVLSGAAALELHRALQLRQGAQGSAPSAALLPPVREEDEDISTRVYAQASPAVVAVIAGRAQGSGSILDAEGLVLSNAHVVTGTPAARSITVRLSDGRQFAADIVGFDPTGLDLVALRLRNAGELPTLPLAPPRGVRVGQRAFAIGSPFGLENTFTLGIVSRVDAKDGTIQTDAAINPGNSGGPLLNSRAELVGVNTAIVSTGEAAGSLGIGFAIPVTDVHHFLQALSEGRLWATPGRVRTPGAPETAIVKIDGPPVTGRLGPESNVLTSDGSYFGLYEFAAEAGQGVVLDLSSDDFDALLMLLDADGEIIALDDDSGEGTNARITVRVPHAGTYTVVVNTFEEGEEGTYVLTLRSQHRPR